MTDKLLRTFLAVPIPGEVRSKKNMLYSTLETIEGEINWVKSAHLHLTLKFLGQTPESSINGIIDEIEKITPKFNPFDLCIEGTGCFPIETRPRTLWLGVNGETSPLLKLVEKIDSTLDTMGFPKSNQDYTPHITLARIKYPQKNTPIIDPFLKSSYGAINFPVNRVQFFCSELHPSGTIYSILKTFPLGEKI